MHKETCLLLQVMRPIFRPILTKIDKRRQMSVKAWFSRFSMRTCRQVETKRCIYRIWERLIALLLTGIQSAAALVYRPRQPQEYTHVAIPRDTVLMKMLLKYFTMATRVQQTFCYNKWTENRIQASRDLKWKLSLSHAWLTARLHCKPFTQATRMQDTHMRFAVLVEAKH